MRENLAFLDTETSGLDPDKHSIWEVALITPDEREHVWQFPINEMDADPFALEIGHYWERKWTSDFTEVSRISAIYEADSYKSRRKHFPDEGLAIKPRDEWCRWFQKLTANLHLVGMVPSFDEERLRKLLKANGVLPRWHYHIVDCEALIAGKLGIEPPWKSEDLSRMVGVEPPSGADRHTALGDARWAKAIFEAVFST
jgi:hypothetical protein